MAKLALSFGETTNRNLTKYEINEIAIAAQGASAIVHVMQEYVSNNPQGEADNSLGVYGCVFQVLEWLMVPVTDYLSEYAGKEAEPKKEQPETAKS